MNKLKEVAFNAACSYLLTPKRIVEISSDVRCIDCKKKDVTMLVNTSNNIMRIQIEDKYIYFRECKRHTKIHQYLANEIEYYYTKIHPELSDDRIYIENALLDKKNFKKFIHMGMTNDTSSGAYYFCIGNGAKHIGLEGMAFSMEERVRDFVQFIWGDLFVYRLNRGLKTGDYQTYNAVRSISTYRLADLLGLHDLIPKTEYVKLCIDGELILFGTAMNEAPGFSVEKMDENARINICSPALQRALNNLNVLDVFCLEKDHRPGNYNVTIDSGKVNNVIAFDNDSPNSFGIGSISFETYTGCSPWTVRGHINRPYIDIDLAERILKITDNDLNNALGELLNVYQLATLKNRFHKIKKILAQTPGNKFIEKEKWSDDTIREELSGAYGKTYLTKFLEGQEFLHQPWIKNDENDFEFG